MVEENITKGILDENLQKDKIKKKLKELKKREVRLWIFDEDWKYEDKEKIEKIIKDYLIETWKRHIRKTLKGYKLVFDMDHYNEVLFVHVYSRKKNAKDRIWIDMFPITAPLEFGYEFFIPNTSELKKIKKLISKIKEIKIVRSKDKFIIEPA